jgi:hypothetical protein
LTRLAPEIPTKETPMTQRREWTILTYIAAHNNLSAMGRKSLFEILTVGSRPQVLHGVLYDGLLPERHAGAAARYVIGDPGFVASQEMLGDVDSGDAEQLLATARWLFAQYPAERHGLILWSHGSGWEPAEIARLDAGERVKSGAVTADASPRQAVDGREAKERSAAAGSRALFRSTLRTLLSPARAAERAILFDDGSGHSLDTLELARVAGQIAAFVDRPLEFLGMDACLMANVEVAYELRHAVRYLVASEELVPGHSWPYGAIFGDLCACPAQNGADLARRAVERYGEYYAANPPANGDVTKVAVDLGRIGETARAIDALAMALCRPAEAPGTSFGTPSGALADILWAAQYATRQRETRQGQRQPNKFDWHLWDIGSLVSELAAAAGASPALRQAATACRRALQPGAGAILAERHRGEWFDGLAGLSVYLIPPGWQRVSPYYRELSFARDTHWSELLAAYHA